MLVPANRAKLVTYAGVNPRNYITVHQTGNTNRGANADMHARLQYNGNSRAASWHEQVDDKECVQSFAHTAKCWHGGDGRTGAGSNKSIAIEICVNSDGDYTLAVRNGARRVAQLMKMYNIPISRVVQHNHWSGKACPAQIRAGKNGINWSAFLKIVQEELEGPKVGATVTQKKPPAPAPTPAPAPEVKNAAAKRSYAPGEVKAIQERLYAAGFYTGRIDDDYGPLTAAAVRAYQAAQVYPRLVQDGDWGLVVEAHYAWTVRLQETLNLWKSTSPKLRVDGSLQSVTTAAIARWQTRNRAIYLKHGGRIADGIPGPITAAALGIPAHP